MKQRDEKLITYMSTGIFESVNMSLSKGFWQPLFWLELDQTSAYRL